MHSIRFGVVVCFSAVCAWGQCPTPNFARAAEAALANRGVRFAGGLQRQPDGSFTRQRYQTTSPYTRLDSTANFQASMVNCTLAAPRMFHLPPGWLPFADQRGTPSMSEIFTDLTGAGNGAGIGVVRGGLPGGPATDSLAVALSNSDATFKSAGSQLYGVSQLPAGVLAADLNNDGKKDIVVLSLFASISVFLGNGDGTLKAPATYQTGQTPVAVVALDLNHDGFPDLVTANNGSSDVSVLINNGDGTFKAAATYPAGTFPESMAIGDFNGDGKPDLVLGSPGMLTILPGNGDGTFRAGISVNVSFYPRNMAVGDFNKDGKTDLVVTDNGSVILLTGDGHNGFPAQNYYAADTINAQGLMVMDYDGDGNLDVVLANGHPDAIVPDSSVNSIVVLFGRGDGTLVAPPGYPAGAFANSVAFADFNNDAKIDMVVASSDSRDLRVYLGAGGGAFQSPTRITVQGPGGLITPGSVVARDLRGNGKSDLVVADLGGNSVYVLLGQGDGSFQAPVGYPAGGNVKAVAAADVDGNGKLDLVAVSPGILGTLLGNGDGTFQAVKTAAGAGSNPVAVIAVDLNKDGKPDVAVLNTGTLGNSHDDGGVLVYLNPGNGNFGSPVAYFAGTNPNSMAAADFKGDGALDLAVTTSLTQVDVLLNNGSGVFHLATFPPTQFYPSSIAAADVSLDGKIDLVVGHCCGQSDVTIMVGNGDGTFQPETEFTSAVAVSVVAIADVDGDGKPDLVTGSLNYFAPGITYSTFSVFRNTTVSTVVTSVTSTAANGVYGVGGTIPLTVTYSGPVTVTGAPKLTLNSTGSALYASGTGTATLTFNYMVGSVQTSARLDAIAFVLNGGTILDANSVATSPTLPAPGAAGSLGVNKSIAIDTVTPVVTSVTTTTAAGTYGVGAGIPISVAFNKNMVVTGTPQLALNSGGTAVYTSGTGTNTLIFTYTVAAGENVAKLDAITLSGGTITDTDTGPNAAILTLTDAGGAGSISNTKAIIINTAVSLQTPSPVSASPSSGPSSAQPVTLVFTNPHGAASFQVLDVLINNVLDGRHACYVAFVPSGPTTGSVFLVDDGGDAGGPYQGLLPGSGSVSNSQCTINGAGTSVATSGNDLTLNLSITYTPGFAGNKIYYMSAQDKAGSNSGWQALGTVSMGNAPAGPWVGGVNPGRRTTSALQPYIFTFTDTNGLADISVADVLINSAIDGRQACYVAIVPISATSASILLVDNFGNAGGPYAGMVLPGTDTISNGQCTINGTGSLVNAGGNAYQVRLQMSFNHSFAGNQVFFLAARSATQNSDWQSVGTISVP